MLKTIEGYKAGNNEVTKRSFCQIEKRLLPAKLSFFLLKASACTLPFLNVFLISIGLSASQVGVINGIGWAIKFFSGPFWGGLADYTRRHKLVLTTLSLLSFALMVPLPWIALLMNSLCPSKSLCENQGINQDVVLEENKICSISGNILFYTMLFMLGTQSFFYGSLPNFLDAAVINVNIGKNKEVNYGAQRLFGAAGAGIATFIAGLAADHYNHATLSRYTAVFFVYIPFMLLFVPTGNILLYQVEGRIQRKKGERIFVFRLLLRIFSRMDNVMILLLVFVMGAAKGISFDFLFMLMKDEMKATKSFMGICTMLACVSEVVIFPFTTKIITLVGGIFPSIIIGVFSYFIRFLCISYIENPIMILPVQTFHSVGFALFWTAVVEHAKNISDQEILTSAFGVMKSSLMLGRVISALLGGVLYQNYGGRILFRAASIMYVIFTLIMLLYYYGMVKTWKKRSRKKPMDEVNNESEKDALLKTSIM